MGRSSIVLAACAAITACDDRATVQFLVEDDLRAPLVGARAEAFDVDDTLLAAGTTDATGYVRLTLDPPDGFTHVRLAGVGHRLTDQYSNSFWLDDLTRLDGSWLVAVREDVWASWYAAAGITATPGRGAVEVRSDATGGDVSALNVIAPGGGVVLYGRAGLPDPTATETDATGTAFLLDAPVGATLVTVRAGDAALCHLFAGGRDVTVVADGVVRVTVTGQCDFP